MERQSILKQVLLGAFFGVLFALVNRLNAPNAEPLLSASGLGYLFGSTIGGIVL
jgi:hypothetical protein